MMTLSITIFSFLVGAVLAQQFKVRVLLPAFALVMGAGITSVQTNWFIDLLAAAISLQIGYFFGIGFRHFLAAVWSKRSAALPSATTSAPHASR
jgi:uncharacterized membrane protein